MTRIPIDARPPHIRDTDNQREDEAIQKLMDDRLQVLNLIDALRKDEGHAVTIVCDNPGPGPANAVEVCGDWTEWKDRRFTGNTLLEALSVAYLEMTQRQGAMDYGRKYNSKEIADVTKIRADFEQKTRR